MKKGLQMKVEVGCRKNVGRKKRLRVEEEDVGKDDTSECDCVDGVKTQAIYNEGK